MLNANPWMVRAKMVVGDHALSAKERKEYITDMLKFECSRQFEVGVFKSHIKPGSAADRVISRGYDLGDFRIMYFDWLAYYEGLRLQNVLGHAQRYVARFFEAPKTESHLLDHLSKIESEYHKLLGIERKMTTETDAEFNSRWNFLKYLWFLRHSC